MTAIPKTSPNTRISNRSLFRLVQLLALFYLIFSVAYYLFFQLPDLIPKAICAESDVTACFLSIPPNVAEEIERWGFDYHLIYYSQLVVDFFVNCLFGSVAVLLILRRGDDVLALLLSLTLIGVELGHPTYNLASISVFLFIYLFPLGYFLPRWTALFIIPELAWNILQIAESDFVEQFTFITVFITLFGLILQVYRYFRIYDSVQRQQVKWLMIGLSAPITFFVILTPILTIMIDSSHAFGAALTYMFYAYLGWLPIIFFPLTLVFSITRYRLWDIDLVINKSLVYGIFLGMALVLFAAVLAGLQIIIGQSQPLPALLIALAVSAVLFRPAQKQIQNFVDRRIYRLNFNLNELAAVQKEREVTKPGALTGKTLSGYEVGNLIGKGGMGEIYRAFKDEEVVAIKTLLPELVQDKELLTRFQREIETGQRLKHHNIAEVFDSGISEGMPYLVMEYIDGQDLRSSLKNGGAFDEETARQIMQDICAALTVAHAEGFVHRDLKPANIMLRDNGEAILMDFGISKTKDARTITGTGAIGTIDYMAPEQIMSAKEVDHRADIYALGIVAFELLTGEKPFKGGAAQVMFAHIQQPPPYARDINPEIPEHIADAIEKAMQKDPQNRFQSVEELREAF